MFLRRALVPVVLVGLLAGCGTHLGTPNARVLSASQLRAHSRDAAGDLIAGLRNTAAGLNTFTGTVSFWETKGGDVQTSTADVFTAKPSKLRANITDSSSATKRGVNLVYLGDKKVTAKLGWFSKTMDYTDPQVLSMHGWRIDQTDLSALMNGLTDANGQDTLVGPVTVHGVAGQAVSVTSPTLLPGVTKEVVVLDPTTFVPLQLEAYINADVIYRVEITKAKVNPKLPADIFVL
jgi:outer membrane lipoprotein-sorting protein